MHATPVLQVVFRDKLSLCTVALSCWNMFGLDLLVSMKGNLESTVYSGVLQNCVLQTSWQQFGKGSHMGVIVRSR